MLKKKVDLHDVFKINKKESNLFQAKIFCTTYSASIPIKVERFDWESILFSGCFPVVKISPKCTAKEITEFCKEQSAMISFEEKISLYLLQLTETT